MDNYDKDRRSAFVGNLPLSMTPESLENMAAGCGEVVKVNLYKKAIPSMPGMNFRTMAHDLAAYHFNRRGQLLRFCRVQEARLS